MPDSRPRPRWTPRATPAGHGSCSQAIARRERQPDAEPGVAGNGLHPDVAMVAANHNPEGDVEPEAGAVAHWLGSEERLENPVLDLGRDPGASVAELDQQHVSVERGADGERPGPVHRRNRVVDQVGPDLIQLAREGRYPRQRMVIIPDDRDAV